MSKNSVLNAISRCLATGDYSDLEIHCKSKVWKAHRVVVCSQSSVMHAMCMSGFKEATTGVIDLPDDNPLALSMMLEFLYTNDYNAAAEGVDLGPLEQHAQVYCLADKYNIDALMELAKAKYTEKLDKGPHSDDFFHSIAMVYTPPQSARSLRQAAVKFARARLKKLPLIESVKQQLKEVVADVPEFSFDLLEEFITKPILGECRACGPQQKVDLLQVRCQRCERTSINSLY